MDFSAWNQLDWVIAAVMGLSALLGLWRGVVREVVSVAGWAVGILLAFHYSAELAPHLAFFTAFGEMGRVAASAVLILVLTILAFAVAGALLRLIIKALTGGVGDSLLGLLFGLSRGALIVMAGVFVASFTSAPQGQLWQKSVLMPAAEKALEMAKPLMPESLREIEEVARKQQRAAKAAWDAKFKL